MCCDMAKKPRFPSYRGLKWQGIIFGNIWYEDSARTSRHATSRESSVFWAPRLITSSGSEAGRALETGNKTCKVVINNFCSLYCELCMYDIMYYLQQTEAEVGFWENYKRAQNYFIPVGHQLACNSGQVLPASHHWALTNQHLTLFNTVQLVLRYLTLHPASQWWKWI